MSPAKHVLLAVGGAALIFAVAGGRVNKLVAQAKGQPPPDTGEALAGTLAGWAGVLVILVFIADVQPVSGIGVSFAWLIFFAVLFGFGEDAAKNVSGLIPQTAAASTGGLPAGVNQSTATFTKAREG